MISVKCPACGLVDWNVGDCKRCGTSLVGLGADGEEGGGYFSAAYEDPAQARSVRTARRVMTACGIAVLALTAVGALYLANRPAKKQWFWSFYRKEPTVAEIFAHNLEVSGGAERIAKLRSFRAEGRLKFVGGEAAQVAAAIGGQVTFVSHVKEPDKVVTEIEIGPPTKKSEAARERELAIKDLPCLGGPCRPGPPEIRLSLRRGFDGRKGWEYVERTILTPGSTVPVKQYSSRELTGDALERMKRSALVTGLSTLDDKYTSLKLNGRGPVKWVSTDGTGYEGLEWDAALRGHEAYLVSGVSKEGKDETLYFDTLTGLLLRVDFETEDEEGDAVNVECHLGDYKEVGGLKLPHRLHFKRGEETMTFTFEKYVPNDPIPDSTFESPEPTE